MFKKHDKIIYTAANGAKFEAEYLWLGKKAGKHGIAVKGEAYSYREVDIKRIENKAENVK